MFTEKVGYTLGTLEAVLDAAQSVVDRMTDELRKASREGALTSYDTTEVEVGEGDRAVIKALLAIELMSQI